MKPGNLIAVAVLCTLPFWSGCCLSPPPPEDTGGFKAEDFQKISLNGFDPVDNAVDKNDYAWSMEYFQADGNNPGYVYVGTGNDMMGTMREGVSGIASGHEFAEGTVRPPEIRRYRPDIDRLTWQRVFDIRQVEPADYYSTVGFRYMKAYRAKSDGVNYLYAATLGHTANLWRTSTGEPNSWSIAWTTGSVGSIRWMEVHNGILYMALTNDALEGEHVGKIWATDGNQFWPVMEDGFGNPENRGIQSLISYNGWLYAGTSNIATGYEIWKLAGPDANDGPIRVVANGGPSGDDHWACSPCIFQGKLYYGSLILMMDTMLRGFPGGATIIRIDENDQWETVVGPDSLSGYSSGFNRRLNAYIWSMGVHDGWLYAGTFDLLSPFTGMLEDPIGFIKSMMPRGKNANVIDFMGHSGADLYKTQDGVTWYPVTLEGFGNVGNYGFRTLMSVGSDFYVGTANASDGLEVWKATSTGN
jgi:hypothetical protein